MLDNIALLLISTLGFIASLIAVVTFVSPNFRRRLADRMRPMRVFRWPEIPDKIADAKKRVDILQTWIPGLRLELPKWKEALKSGAEFRVLLCDQRLVPFRLRSREAVSSLLPQNTADIAGVSEKFEPGQIQARFYEALPFGPIYRIDEWIYWGLFTAHQDSMVGPAFATRVDSDLGRAITASFKAMWRTGSSRSGELLLPGSPDVKLRGVPTDETAVSRLAGDFARRLTRSDETFAELRAGRSGMLALVRHGQTDLNRSQIFCGSLDVRLNASGKQAARELGTEIGSLKWDRVYSSPLRRAIETARELLGGEIEGVELRDELRERAMGDLEGLSKESYADAVPTYRGVDVRNEFFTKAVEGESHADLLARISRFLPGLISEVEAGERILLCTHEGPIRIFELLFGGRSINDVCGLQVENCSLWCYVPVGRPNRTESSTGG